MARGGGSSAYQRGNRATTSPRRAPDSPLGRTSQMSTPGVPDGTPNPAGPRYPWSVGGSSREVGVPDNWDQYYPTEGHGRGDAWMSPKFELNRDAEVAGSRTPSSPALSANARKRAQSDPAYAALHPEALSGNPMDWPGQGQDRGPAGPGPFGYSGGPKTRYNDPHYNYSPEEESQMYRDAEMQERRAADQAGVSWDDWVKGEQEKGFRDANGVPYGDPGALPNPKTKRDAQGNVLPNTYDYDVGGWPKGFNHTEFLLKGRGIQPGPVNKIGQGIGSGGYWNGERIVGPNAPPPDVPLGGRPTPGPGGVGGAQSYQPLGDTQRGLLGLAAGGIQAGQTQQFGNRKVFKNKAGALVDITDPNNRQRITNRAGQMIQPKGAAQAAQPPPQGQGGAGGQGGQQGYGDNPEPWWGGYGGGYGGMQRPEFATAMSAAGGGGGSMYPGGAGYGDPGAFGTGMYSSQFGQAHGDLTDPVGQAAGSSAYNALGGSTTGGSSFNPQRYNVAASQMAGGDPTNGAAYTPGTLMNVARQVKAGKMAMPKGMEFLADAPEYSGRQDAAGNAAKQWYQQQADARYQGGRPRPGG